MSIQRKQTKEIVIGHCKIGGNNPVLIQSMTNTDTRNVAATVAQMQALQAAGCEMVRVAVPDAEAAKAIAEIKRQVSMPIVADIHFDYRLALLAMENGADKLRLNPGNIGDKERVKQVVTQAKARNIPIRIGVNAGSLEKSLLAKYGGVTAEALVESALGHVAILEALDFHNIVLSIKASDVPLCIQSHAMLAAKTDYPLHIGITEAGIGTKAVVKSSVGIGALLAQGLGDTVRVSLTGDPVQEISCAKAILESLGLRQFGATIISCPTCGRTQINLEALAAAVEEKCAHLKKPIKIAVMGCEVNGPGEAREADIGIAGGKGCGLIFKKGQIVAKVPEEELLNKLLAEIDAL